MQKYVITRTKGDNVEILCVAESKEDGMRKGAEIARIANPKDGLIALERAELDENNNPIGNKFELFKTWRL